tara:strand:+ start:176 stop:1531 length:1356 start_codon:yes stop_codon:yes gene_type:complete
MKISERSAVLFNNIKLPSINRCFQKAQELQAAERSVGAVEVAPAKLVDLVLKRSGEGLSHRERRALPYFILDPRFRDFNPEFGNAVLLNFSNGRAFWPTLFNAWLFHYDMSSSSGKAVRKALSANQSRLSDKMLKIDACFNLLSAKPNLHEVASLILQGEITSDRLQDINFSADGVSGGQFSLALLSGFAKHCMSGSLTDLQLNKLVQILCPHGSLHESIRDVALVSFIYSIESRPRESEAFVNVKKIIDSNFKDPRIDAHQWPAISEYLGGEKTRNHCIDVVRQWHIFQSISLFFKLIEEVVEGAEHEHQFPQRRKFWIDYFDKGKVSDAWVILGTRGAQEALRYQQSGDPDFASLSWAKLSASKNDQCVLLMQIGDAKVVEWSHSGACRVWAGSDRNAPMMSRTKYDGSDLRAAVADDSRDRIIHDPPGRWRAKVEQRVNAYSGIRRFV